MHTEGGISVSSKLCDSAHDASAAISLPFVIESTVRHAKLAQKDPDRMVVPVQDRVDPHETRPVVIRRVASGKISYRAHRLYREKCMRQYSGWFMDRHRIRLLPP